MCKASDSLLRRATNHSDRRAVVHVKDDLKVIQKYSVSLNSTILGKEHFPLRSIMLFSPAARTPPSVLQLVQSAPALFLTNSKIPPFGIPKADPFTNISESTNKVFSRDISEEILQVKNVNPTIFRTETLRITIIIRELRTLPSRIVKLVKQFHYLPGPINSEPQLEERDHKGSKARRDGEKATPAMSPVAYERAKL